MVEKKGEATSEKEREVMSWQELCREFRATLRITLGEPLPGEFWQHMRAGRKERLLAVRSLIDVKIARLERQQERAARQTTKMTEQ